MGSGDDRIFYWRTLKALLCLVLFNYQQLFSIKSRIFGKNFRFNYFWIMSTRSNELVLYKAFLSFRLRIYLILLAQAAKQAMFRGV